MAVRSFSFGCPPVPGRAAGRPAGVNRVSTRARANSDLDSAESRSVLEAFFYGRALADTLNERLGDALADAIAEVSKLNAEASKAFQKFQDSPNVSIDEAVQQLQQRQQQRIAELGTLQDEVRVRAERAMEQDLGTTVSSNSSKERGSSQVDTEVAIPDLQTTMDEVRADIAAARATLRRLKMDKVSSTVDIQ